LNRQEEHDVSYAIVASALGSGEILELVQEGVWEDDDDGYGSTPWGAIDYDIDDESLTWCDEERHLGAFSDEWGSLDQSWGVEEQERVIGSWEAIRTEKQVDDQQRLAEQEGGASRSAETGQVQRRRHHKGEGAGRSILSEKVLNKSLATAEEPPRYFCAVCCQILYQDETYPLILSPMVKRAYEVEGRRWNVLRDIPWPCLHYGRDPTMKNQRLTTCKAHQRVTEKVLRFVSVESMILVLLYLY